MVRKNPRPKSKKNTAKSKKNTANPKKENMMKCGWFMGYYASRSNEERLW